MDLDFSSAVSSATALPAEAQGTGLWEHRGYEDSARPCWTGEGGVGVRPGDQGEREPSESSGCAQDVR